MKKGENLVIVGCGGVRRTGGHAFQKIDARSEHYPDPGGRSIHRPLSAPPRRGRSGHRSLHC